MGVYTSCVIFLPRCERGNLPSRQSSIDCRFAVEFDERIRGTHPSVLGIGVAVLFFGVTFSNSLHSIATVSSVIRSGDLDYLFTTGPEPPKLVNPFQTQNPFSRNYVIFSCADRAADGITRL